MAYFTTMEAIDMAAAGGVLRGQLGKLTHGGSLTWAPDPSPGLIQWPPYDFGPTLVRFVEDGANRQEWQFLGAFDYTTAGDAITQIDGTLYYVDFEDEQRFADWKLDLEDGVDVAAFIGAADRLAFLLSGGDVVRGSNDDDVLAGFSGDDELFGHSGNDVLVGGLGADRLDGGHGRDAASYAGAAAAVTVDMLAIGLNRGEAEGDRYLALEDLVGSRHADVLRGDRGDNRIDGGAGDDVLEGRKGDDILTGGAGADMLTGNTGADRFAFRSAGESGNASATRDTIADFNPRQGDRIDLKAIAGGAKFKFRGDAAFSGKAMQLRADEKNGHTFVYGDIDGDGRKDFSIKLDGFTGALEAADFVL